MKHPRSSLRVVLVLLIAALCGVLVTAGSKSKPRKPAKPKENALAGQHPAKGPSGGPIDSTIAAAAAAVSGSGAEASTVSTLVLYDSTGPYGWLGELYGMMTANLVSHFGFWTAHPVRDYVRGELSQYSAAVYIGSTYDEPLPAAFLDDVAAATTPVVWAYDNIWQFTNRVANFSSIYGWNWSGFDFSAVAQVAYKNVGLARYPANAAGIMNYSTVGAPATVLARAVRSDGTSFPWAIRSRKLTYIGEVPLAYIAEGDRYLAFADLLFDALAPATPERHRALVRIEDVNPTSDPAALRAIADYLWNRNVPFSVGVVPLYRDPDGAYASGVPQTVALKDSKGVVEALKYMQKRGGELIAHGWTHQYATTKNPYNAVSTDDFEFYRVTENADHSLTYVGPIPGDSGSWAAARLESALKGFKAANLARPHIFEFPHYAASAADYLAVDAMFQARYERSLYFRGLLTGQAPDPTHLTGQQFPYVVRDVYGTMVLPENLGAVEPQPWFIFPARLPSAIVTDAKRSRVVRDGYASFFFHPFWDLSYLSKTIEGIQAAGYTFVSASDAMNDIGAW